ncbi:CaiB/BaiF CoA-transferase family protein [Caldilinea sp.]|uniref:CaiB/BaiF CoA transferase family protein n=1 Tax=Caldilinea sp. TaxID=2293560 RepID=UPI002C79E086|nr:CoA transferase [Anaerolineales bacterium]HQY93879.1 CaiB/BaiF CoA-transferase family protein [Caldilinea sp.]HRA65551.1 CaiB/BaiF CoA-transferase family protein [Caldilinea sp.]
MPDSLLSDIFVLDLSRILAGPYCTMVLADYGADVIKVEEPGSGDGTRGWGPPWVGDQSAYFLAANRNKRSITVDLKTAAGRQIVQELAAHADVVIENFKVGGAARLGVDYATLAALNPRLVYCSITGYGQSGPHRDRAGYDFIIQAQGGVMSITGAKDGEPAKVGVAIADITAGLFAATAILAALHERQRSGKGQAIDVALLDAQIAWLANVAQNYLATGEPPARYGNAHPSIVPYETFATADGAIAVGIGSDAQYRKFCAAVGRLDLAEDARFRTNQARVEQREVLIPLLQALFRTRTSSAWLELLTTLDVPAGPINDIPTALNDPQVQARAMVQEVDHATAGRIKVLGPVAKFDRTPATVRGAPPPLGHHTGEVLQEMLGYHDEQIAELRRLGVI